MSDYIKLGLAVALTSAVSLFPAVQSSAAAPEQANGLTAAIRTEINKSPALHANHLSVDVVDGVVYVRGTVDSEAEHAEVNAAAIRAADGAKVVDLTEIGY